MRLYGALTRSVPLAALLCSGCLVFDPPDFPRDGDAGPGDAGEEHMGTELADSCGDISMVPLLASDHDHREIGTEDHESAFNSVSCRGAGPVEGPDAFFRFTARAEQRWHIAVEPRTPDIDAVLYLMPICDSAACSLFVDNCGPGGAEELTIIPSEAVEYIVGVDGVGADDFGEFHLTAIAGDCGDTEVVHGEGCDDGNLADGDGCSRLCRVELAGADVLESEIGAAGTENNGHASANVLRVDPPAAGATNTMAVTGSLASSCDQDHFLIDVPEGATLNAAVRNTLGCMGTPPIAVTVIRPPSPISQQTGSCPSTADDTNTEGLSAGEYQVMVTGPGIDAAVDYVLDVELTLPAP